MSFLPYGRQAVSSSDEEAVLEALRSEWLTQGPAVGTFEESLAAVVGARHAIAVSSGTAALHLACLALGVGPGDIVATSPVTFVATANAAVYCGASPAFVDVEPETICLSPEALEEQLTAGLRPKVVVPVHFAGLPCDMGRLAALGERFGFSLLEDACHALGAKYRLGGAWGPVGDCRASAAAVFSFHPVKHITTGEGGAIVTNDAALAHRLRRLRSHGVAREDFRVPTQAVGPNGDARPWYYEMQEVGFNYRITDLQCRLGSSQLARLANFVERRRQLAARYAALLGACSGKGVLRLPREAPGRESSWHLFAVRLRTGRDRAYLALRDRGIGTQVHYLPVHLQPYYRERFATAEGLCPVAEAYFEEALSLPLFPAMADGDVDRVAAALAEVLGEAA